jgi:hypothetical protein
VKTEDLKQEEFIHGLGFCKMVSSERKKEAGIENIC